MNNLSWKKESIEVFKAILKECEANEDFENCVRLRDNIAYLKTFMQAPNQTDFPHPFETIEDDESIFIKFIPKKEIDPGLDERINKIIEDIDKQIIKSNKNKKRKPND